MSRYLVGMSGDKDAMIRHLEKCEKRKLEQFAEIKEIANTTLNSSNNGPMQYEQCLLEIMELCNVYVDKRSDKQKMQDQIVELQKKVEEIGDAECGCC